MFTGIIETLGEVVGLEQEQSNLHITIKSSVSDELKIDQSIAHNGVCLTVISQQAGTHTVTAIQETLLKSSLGTLEIGRRLNLERCMRPSDRLDGHFVQGHVDLTAKVTGIESAAGSWRFTFEFAPTEQSILVNKGSVTVDGTSLTVVEAQKNGFSVAIIPYTYENTVFGQYKIGDTVNIEFDVIGKYIVRLFDLYKEKLILQN